VPGPITRVGCGNSFASCRRKPPSPPKRLPASVKTTTTPVYVESSRTRTFACAYDWPGWCRSGKDEASALAALAAYAPRYAAVAKQARIPFEANPDGAFRVVERIAGSASTDFGVPGAIAKSDITPLAAAEGKRLASLLQASWAVYDQILAAAPAELRKGPRGGGRDRDKMADHVRDAEGAYIRKLGLRLDAPDRHDRRAVAEFRAAIADAIRRPSKGMPLVEKGWPQRYAARRIAWHLLDHAWEMQDRSDQSRG
jgi:hypothetical protein